MRLFTKKWKFLIFLEPRSHSREQISVKIRVDKQTHVHLGRAKFHMNRCNEWPLRSENADFRHVSKFKYRLTPHHGDLPVNNTDYHNTESGPSDTLETLRKK